MFPVKHLPALIILLRTLNPAILRLHKPIPISPVRILHLHIPILIRIPLLEPDQLIQIRQHVDEHAAIRLPLQEILESELDAVGWFEEVDHLADDVLEVEI